MSSSPPSRSSSDYARLIPAGIFAGFGVLAAVSAILIRQRMQDEGVKQYSWLQDGITLQWYFIPGVRVERYIHK